MSLGMFRRHRNYHELAKPPAERVPELESTPTPTPAQQEEARAAEPKKRAKKSE